MHAEAVLSYFRDSKRLVEINAEDKVENVFYETCLALRARGIYPGLHKDGRREQLLKCYMVSGSLRPIFYVNKLYISVRMEVELL